MEIISSIGFLMLVVVHLALGGAVYTDAKLRDKSGELAFVWPIVWCFATVVGGIIAGAVYWLIHYSVLNPSVAAMVLRNTRPAEQPSNGFREASDQVNRDES
ncbi:MAG: hypothetical protein AAFX06_31155 [Planctomycetota bacterium]